MIQEKQDKTIVYKKTEIADYQQIDLSISKIKKILIYCFLIQLILNLVLIILIDHGYSRFYGLKKFYFDNEDTIPTFFSSMNLFLSAALLGMISSIKSKLNDSYKRHWQVLSLLFILLAIDEVAGLHEMTIEPLIRLFNFSGYFQFAWVIFGIIFMIFFSISYLRFLVSLPKPYALGFFFSCLIYVSGTIGVEIINANLYVNREISSKDLVYNIFTTLEESFEMIGIIMFILILLSYLKSMKVGTILNIK